MSGLFAECLVGLSGAPVLKVENAPSGAEADAELVGVEGLGEVIVRAGFMPVDQVLRFGARG